MNVQKLRASVRFGPNLPWHNRAFRLLIRSACFVLFDVQVKGLSNVPASNCIIVSNHLSWIDHLLLMAVLPGKPRPYLLGASQSISSPFKRWLFDTFGGVVPIERGATWMGKDALEMPAKVIQSGASLFLFPEGDVSKEEGKLLPLKRGIGHLTTRCNCPILPIALSGVRELYWRKPIQVIIGKPFCADTALMSHRMAIDHAVAQVEEELRKLIPVYVEPKMRKRLRFLTNLSDHL